MLRKRFQGCLLGALIGDCLGGYWEMMSWKGTHPIDSVNAKIASQVEQAKSGSAPLISYTDDTAMTIVMAQSLVDSNGFNELDMAKKFTEEFFSHPERGYGASVSTVFCKLRDSNYRDVYGPAQQQFKGQGSCGNGGGMRISPAALYGHDDDTILIKVARDSTRITHAHPSGVYGAILQAMAIKLALQTPSGSLNVAEFVQVLKDKIKPFEELMEPLQEEDKDELDPMPTVSASKLARVKGQPTYTTCLCKIEELLSKNAQPDDVEQALGHGVLAAEAIPCALYAFLKCCHESFETLIPYAISLGGDADTIASMAGAIGGAYWGIDAIPSEWISTCEAADHVTELADKLFDLTHSNN